MIFFLFKVPFFHISVSAVYLVQVALLKKICASLLVHLEFCTVHHQSMSALRWMHYERRGWARKAKVLISLIVICEFNSKPNKPSQNLTLHVQHS